MTLTPRLKQRLWAWYGSDHVPAEWDGQVYGGGKISQRFWEYFIAIDMLALQPGAVVLDIGGGSNAMGLTMFPRLLADAGLRVIVLDANFGDSTPQQVETTYRAAGLDVIVEPGLADRESLSQVLRRHNPTHLSSVSVLEHASPEQQRGIFEAIEAEFRGERAVFTVEFHETTCFFEQQMTTATLSGPVSALTRYYLDRIERSPLHCVNAVSAENDRLWYPLALCFERCTSLATPAFGFLGV